tara:strand:+ start:387 stop:1070 length:684 start_codon:yes stop_codon:yes gene_type:complete
MGRRISDSDPSGKKPCAFCRTMRVVVIFAVMVVMLMAYANKLHWLEDVDFTSLFGYLVVAFFFTVLGYRVWDEYGRPKQSQAELDAKRAQREKQFDEIDALEAERALLEPLAATEVKLADVEIAEVEIAEVEIAEVETAEAETVEAGIAKIEVTKVEVTEVNVTEAELTQVGVNELDVTQVETAEVEVTEIEASELLNPQVKPESDASADPEQLDLLGFSTPNKADK